MRRRVLLSAGRVGVFDGLDRVPWRELVYAFRGEADMPSLFRALLEPEAAVEAAAELLNELHHQGGFVCSAAVEALPFLMEAVESTRVTCRDDLLEIVGRLALTAREVAPFRIAGGWAEAWDATVPRLIALLDDEDPRLRRASASVLEEAVTHADAVVSALGDRWHAQDRSTRLDQVLTIGSLAGSLTAATLPETLIWLRDLTGAPDEQLRFAAALALREALPGRPSGIEPVVTALSGDLTVWSGSEHLSGPPAWTVRWAIDRLSADVDAQEQLCLALLAHPEAERRQGAIRAVGDVLSISRRTRRLLPALREHAADPDITTRTFSLHLLAAHARPGGQNADLFADHLDDEAQAPRSPVVADVAVWALAWSDDDRCLPGLAERIDGRRSAYSLSARHTGKDTGYFLWTPSLQEILTPCCGWARTLLPVILRKLRPDVETELGRSLLVTLQTWGPAAAPAIPQIAKLLGGQLRHLAAEALGAIGTDAISVAPALRDLLDAPEAGLDQPYARREAGVAVPWAYWRLTDDPEPALRALGPRLNDRYGHNDIRRLADLGAHASALVPTLRLLAESREPWTALEAAHALVKITGDTDEGRHILIRPVRNLLDGTAQPIVKPAARYLADIGDLLPGHRSTVEAVLCDGRRHSWAGGWAAIHDDLEIRDLLQTALGESHLR